MVEHWSADAAELHGSGSGSRGRLTQNADACRRYHHWDRQIPIRQPNGANTRLADALTGLQRRLPPRSPLGANDGHPTGTVRSPDTANLSRCRLSGAFRPSFHAVLGIGQHRPGPHSLTLPPVGHHLPRSVQVEAALGGWTAAAAGSPDARPPARPTRRRTARRPSVGRRMHARRR